MSEAPGDQLETEISADTAYWPMHMEPFGEVTFHLSDKATGAFVRFLNFYVKRNGNVPFDEGKLCDRLRYKTVRSLRPVWEELIDAGVVAVTKGLVTCAFGDFILEKVRKARKQKVEAGEAGGAAKARAMAERKSNESDHSRSTGVPGEYNGNTAGIAAETHGTIQQNQWVAPGSASNLKPETLKKNLPPTPSGVKAGAVGGGGGSEIHQIIAGFDKLLAEYFGEGARRRYPVGKDAETAAEWLSLAGGSVEIVMESIEAVMKRDGGKAPGSLARYCNSVPNEIDEYNKPATLTVADQKRNGYGRSNGSVLTSSSPGSDLWKKVLQTARYNGHKDIEDRIKALVAKNDIATANDFARSMEAIASGKKARAAA